MSDQATQRRKSNFVKNIRPIITVILITGIIIFVSDESGIYSQAINQLSTVIQTWTDLASITSPTNYAVNAVVLITVISALVNSFNRDVESQTILSVIFSPGIGFWSKVIQRASRYPFIGAIVPGTGYALRIYFWVFSLSLFVFYSVTYVQSSDSSLIIITITAILGSLTFGSVFGRFEKGLVLSIKMAASNPERYDSVTGKWKYYWALMIPLALTVAAWVTERSNNSLADPTFGELFSALSSIFITTFLAVVILFYLFALLVLFLNSIYRSCQMYRNGELSLRKRLRNRFERYVQKEFAKRTTSSYEYGFPEDIADDLRKL